MVIKVINTVLSLTISIIILSIISYPINYQGIHIKNETGATDYRWEAYQIKNTMLEGFAWLKMDKYGFNTPYEDDKNINYLLMGSSHMQAFNIGGKDNVACILAKRLNLKVYNIGQSGHTLLRIAKNIKCAYDYYKPAQGIIIETDRVVFDKADLDFVLSNKYDDLFSYDNGIVFFLQKYFPALLLMAKQVNQWRKISKINKNQKLEKLLSKDDNQYKISLNQFIKKIRNTIPENLKIIIFFQPKTHLNKEGNLIFDENEIKIIKVFSEICKNNNIIFIDTTSDFIELFKFRHILAHGFINTKVGYGHLNKYGHEIIAKRLVKEINKLSEVTQ